MTPVKLHQSLVFALLERNLCRHQKCIKLLNRPCLVIIKSKSDGQGEAGYVSSAAGANDSNGGGEERHGRHPTVGSSLSVTTKKGHFFVGDLELSEGEGSEVKAGCWAGNQTGWHGGMYGRCWLHRLGVHPREAYIWSAGSQQCLSA